MPKSTFTDAYQVMLDTMVAARKESGVTQVELAKKIGKPQPWISNVERGLRRIDVIEFVAICKAFGSSPEKVFHDITDRLPRNISI